MMTALCTRNKSNRFSRVPQIRKLNRSSPVNNEPASPNSGAVPHRNKKEAKCAGSRQASTASEGCLQRNQLALKRKLISKNRRILRTKYASSRIARTKQSFLACSISSVPTEGAVSACAQNTCRRSAMGLQCERMRR